MSVHKKTELKKITTHQLQEMKNRGEKIAMLTAYDYSMAKIIDGAGIDVILVGDSASNVMAGNETTLPITLDQMIYHATSVVKAVKRALVVVDIPFGYYQGSSGEALRSSIRIMKESGAHAVKLEGGSEVKDSVLRILSAGVPVMGHLGLTPQSIYKFGTYTVRAKEEDEAERLIADAKYLEAGKDAAMQVAAMKPVALDKDDVPQDIISKEIEIGKEIARNEGKPEDMLEKIAIGKLNKFFKDNTLLNQVFVKDGKISVAEYLKSKNPELTATGFKHVKLG